MAALLLGDGAYRGSGVPPCVAFVGLGVHEGCTEGGVDGVVGVAGDGERGRVVHAVEGVAAGGGVDHVADGEVHFFERGGRVEVAAGEEAGCDEGVAGYIAQGAGFEVRVWRRADVVSGGVGIVGWMVVDVAFNF